MNTSRFRVKTKVHSFPIIKSIHLPVTTLIFSNILYNWEDVCCRIDETCYQLHFNTIVRRVLLRSFLLSFGLTYGQENNHNNYCMYNDYLCIEPCMFAHSCVRLCISSSCARCHLQAET